uniref:Glycosyltransferase family 92 protein n=1 Tax=Sparus aurata TaxID=8175 RepID=A0A671TZ20_SPAAU
MLAPRLKKFRWMMIISPVTTILSLILLLWTYTYGPDWILPSLNPVPLPEPLHRGPGQPAPPGHQVSLVAGKGMKTILVSAYQEHRRGKREVRVIAVALRSETVEYHCVFSCEGQLRKSEGSRYVHSDHFDFAYGTADIMCPIPSDCESPSHITVTSKADPEEKPEVDLEVKNKKPENDSFHYNFTVCFSTMYEYKNVLQLVQNLETLQLLGVNRVVIYKTSSSPETQRILDYYTRKGLVEVIPWTLSKFLKVSRSWRPERSPGDTHYFGQIPALHDCLYRYMYQSRYVALHDNDELILPQKVFSWSELFPLLEKKYGPKQCFMFENNVFENDKFNKKVSDWQNVPGVDILTRLYHEPVHSGYGNFKIVVNPRVVFTLTVHGLLDPGISEACSFVDRNIARMYHTRLPKQPGVTRDKLTYDDRLLSYGARFTPTVTTVLRECGLLQKDRTPTTLTRPTGSDRVQAEKIRK